MTATLEIPASLNLPVVQQWHLDLRSGLYLQGYEHLSRRDNEGNIRSCALGVLCIQAQRAGIVQRFEIDELFYGFGDGTEDVARWWLPKSVIKWAGLNSNNPQLNTDWGIQDVVELNEGHTNFMYIADAIRTTYLDALSCS